MKIQFIRDDNHSEDTITITYSKESEVLQALHRYVLELNKEHSKIELYKGETQYYVEVDKILFFETENNSIIAHTKDDMYSVKYRLYELEELLPEQFLRVAKSTILNAKHVYSIDRNVTSSSCIQFEGTYKTVYVSRHYYKDLKNKLFKMRKVR